MTKKADNRLAPLTAETEYLREWCAWVRGDPKLTQWEEEFATSIYRGLDDEDRRFLSHKQKAKVLSISVKTGFSSGPVPESSGEDDDEDESQPSD